MAEQTPPVPPLTLQKWLADHGPAKAPRAFVDPNKNSAPFMNPDTPDASMNDASGGSAPATPGKLTISREDEQDIQRDGAMNSPGLLEAAKEKIRNDPKLRQKMEEKLDKMAADPEPFGPGASPEANARLKEKLQDKEFRRQMLAGMLGEGKMPQIFSETTGAQSPNNAEADHAAPEPHAGGKNNWAKATSKPPFSAAAKKKPAPPPYDFRKERDAAFIHAFGKDAGERLSAEANAGRAHVRTILDKDTGGLLGLEVLLDKNADKNGHEIIPLTHKDGSADPKSKAAQVKIVISTSPGTIVLQDGRPPWVAGPGGKEISDSNRDWVRRDIPGAAEPDGKAGTMTVKEGTPYQAATPHGRKSVVILAEDGSGGAGNFAGPGATAGNAVLWTSTPPASAPAQDPRTASTRPKAPPPAPDVRPA
jgi:hypothetical protein